MILNDGFHKPVLLPQVLDGLKVELNKKYIDATLGGGSYAYSILKKGGVVLGIDRDIAAINFVRSYLKQHDLKNKLNRKIIIEHGNFADLEKIAKKNNFDKVSGIVFDLGLSNYQIKISGRGFTFQKNELLDMRMDGRGKISALNIINNFSREELYEIFSKYAEELNSRPIADAIFSARTLKGPIKTTGQLVEIIEKAVGKNKYRLKTIARIFQALRIVTNEEISNLKLGLEQAYDLLAKNGRLVVVSYHSLEDRIVKLFFEKSEANNKMVIVTRQPIKADFMEIKNNPSSRSAKLRIAEKIYGK